MAMSPVRRRYVTRLSVAMAIYIASLFAGKYLIRHDMVQGPVVWLLALLPGLSVAAVFVVIGMFIVELKDEYVRMLIVRQTLIATGITLAAASIWGFLENFGLVEHLDAFLWAVVWMFSFGIGKLVNRFTHGASGDCW